LGELDWLCLAVADAFLALDSILQPLAIRGDGSIGLVDRVGEALASPW
jgi:hypothetical protein